MRISRIEIQNFRSIKHLATELDETTVFVGANNAGKTAILDAIRIALTRRWGPRGIGFSEYDIHMDQNADDPKESDGVAIEVRLEESTGDEWPISLVNDLSDIVQLDLNTGKRYITLRLSVNGTRIHNCLSQDGSSLMGSVSHCQVRVHADPI